MSEECPDSDETAPRHSYTAPDKDEVLAAQHIRLFIRRLRPDDTDPHAKSGVPDRLGFSTTNSSIQPRHGCVRLGQDVGRLQL